MDAHEVLDVEEDREERKEPEPLNRDGPIPGLDFDVPGWDEDNELPSREDGEDWSDWL